MLSQEERNCLQDLSGSEVKLPDYAVLTYAVCTVEEDACGWGGWMLEGAFATSGDKTGILANGDNPLPTVSLQICPNCGGTIFRTDTGHIFDVAGRADLRMSGHQV